MGWLGCVAQNGAQGFVLFSSESSVALYYFYYNISSISYVPPSPICYGCWIFSRSSLTLFDTVCQLIFSLSDTHFNEATAHLMVEKFTQKVYSDMGLVSDSDDDEDSSCSSSSDDESDCESFIWNGQEGEFLSDLDEPSDRDFSSVCDCDDCLTL